MAHSTFSLPLCDHEITLADDDYREWLTCSCGRYYSKATLTAYKQALDALFAADERAAQIEGFAATQDASRREELGEVAPAAAPTVAQVAAQAANDEYTRDWEATATTATAAATLNRAPVKAATLRPRRALPKLTPQQTLLAVAASLLLIALSIFFGTTWNEPWFSLPLKAGVLAVIVGATAFGSIRSKKYFVIISNFLAALSSGFLALGLYAAAALGLFGDTQIASPAHSPYVPFILLVTGGYSLWLGRRFKVFGWLAVAPITVALAGLLFSASYLSGLNVWPGLAATVGSLAALLVYVVGRLTRLEAPVAASASKKSKKAPTAEEAEAELENKYQAELFDREQVALSNVVRVSAGLSMAYVLLTTLLSLTAGLIGFASTPAVGFFVLAAFWLAASAAIELRGANFIVSDLVPNWAKNLSWNLGFAVLAGATLLQLKSPSAGPNWGLTIADALVGAIVLFSIPNKVADRFYGAARASQVSAGVIWLLHLVLAVSGSRLDTNLFSTWLTVVAAALFAKAWLLKASLFARLSALAGNIAALAPLTMIATANQGLLVTFAITLALSIVWFVANRMLAARLGTSSGESSWILLAVSIVSGALLVIRWSMAEGAWLAVVLAAVLSAAMVWFSTSRFIGKQDTLPFRANAVVWAVAGFLVLAKGDYQVLHAEWAVYALVIFAISMFHLHKTKAISAILASSVAATIATIVTGRWTVDATIAAQIVNPVGFLALAIVFSLLIHRVANTSSREFNLMAALSFGVTWAAFMTYKVQLTASWTPAAATNNSIWTVAVFSLFAAALLIFRLRENAQANLGLFLRFAGVVSLVGSLLAGASVAGAWTSLLLITCTLALSFALSLVTATSQKSVSWFWASYALALSTVVSIQATLLASQSSDVVATWLRLIVPVTLALTFGLHTVMISLGKKVGAKLSWTILPAVSVGAALLAYLTPTFAGYYAATNISTGSDSNWIGLIGFMVLACGYLGLRLSSKTTPESARSLLSTSVVSLALALASIAATSDSDKKVQLAALLGVYGLLLLAQAAIKREVRTNFYGSVLSIAAIWLFINHFTSGATLVLAEFYSVSGALVFLLSSRLLKRAETDVNLTQWRYVLPFIFLAGTVLGVSQLSLQSFASDWLEVLLANAIGLAAFFGSRVKFDSDALARTRALRAVGVISWALALYVSLNDNGAEDWLYEGQLLREVIIGVTVAATMLVFARLERSRAFVIAGYATSVLAGSVTGGYLNFVISFDVPELFTAAIALALLASGLVASSVEVVSTKWRSMAVFGLPLLTVGVPSAIYSWGSVTQKLATLDASQLTRVLALTIGGALLVVLGVRLGNLGLTVAGAAPLALSLVPNIWFRIEDAFSGRTQLEIKALFVGLLLYAALRAIFAAIGTSMKSIVYIGIPVIIAIGPAMLDALGALSQPTLTREDWLRFVIVLSGSLVLLVIGALRKIGGLFVPGAVGVVISALPYAWAQISSQNWALWVVLILVATLLVMVAIRLEQFKTGARTASNWMRELR